MTTAPSLRRGTELLAALESLGPRPALAWHEEGGRIELSGHVLANWVIKAIGHLDAEVALQSGDLLVLDLPPHWKRLVLALAGWSLGARVEILPTGADDVPDDGIRVLATDRPGSDLADDAEEVLALAAVSLAPRFAGELPPLVHDWAQEVRAHPDRLAAALPTWSGPQPGGDHEGVPRLLVPGDGLGQVGAALGAWLAGGGIVGPAEGLDERAVADEAVTGRA